MRIPLWICCVYLIAGFPTGALAAEDTTDRDPYEIVGGEDIQAGEFPWFVRIGVRGTAQDYTCSGAIVAPNWVLTAAHCNVSEDGDIRGSDQIFIHRGHDWTQGEQRTGDDLGQVIPHPTYPSKPGGVSDVALIQLLNPFPGVQPLQILTPEQEKQLASPGTLATLIGAGNVEDGTRPDIARKVTLPIISTQACRENSAWESWKTGSITDYAGCLQGDPANDSRTGDSGGPVVVPLPQGGWGQIGVHRMGGGHEDNAESYPPVFARTAAIYDWIQEQTTPVPVVLTHAFAGPLNQAVATTEITVTNTSPNPCSVELLFHRGTAEAPPIQINGEAGNTHSAELPAASPYDSSFGCCPLIEPIGTARRFTITNENSNDLAVGAVYVFPREGCAAGRIEVEGRYLIRRSDGEIVEAFSIQPQSSSDWMRHGDCRVLTSKFDDHETVGIAFVTAEPGISTPEDSILSLRSLDWDGNMAGIGGYPLPITGEHQAVSLLGEREWSQRRIPQVVSICLRSALDFKLSLIAIGAVKSPRSVQYVTLPLKKTRWVGHGYPVPR